MVQMDILHGCSLTRTVLALPSRQVHGTIEREMCDGVIFSDRGINSALITEINRRSSKRKFRRNERTAD